MTRTGRQVRPRAGVGWPVVRVGLQVLFLAGLVGVWQVAAVASQSVFFPAPDVIGPRMAELFLPSADAVLPTALVEDVFPSAGRILAGWMLATVLGAGLGIVIGRTRNLADYVDPVVNFLRSTPGPALLPVFLIVAGAGTPMRISLICFGAVWPVLLNTIDAVRTSDQTQLDTARMFGLPRRAVIARIVIPSAMPRILAGMHVGLTLAFVLMVVGELNLSTNGIGFQITSAVQLYAFVDMWAWIVLLALLGIVANVAFAGLERALLGWHRASRSQ